MIPAYRLTSKGKDVTANYAGRLLSISVTDQTDEQSDSLQIDLEDTGWQIELPKEGDIIVVELGYVNNLHSVGSFVVDEVTIEGDPDRICIVGRACPFENADKLKAMQAKKSRSFDTVTLGDLVKQIASENGLEPSVDAQLAATQIPHIDQTSESDNNLLTRLARQYGAIYKPTFGRLVFARSDASETVSGKAMPTATIMRSQVSPRWKFTLARRMEYDAVEVVYHDLDWGDTKSVIAGSGEKIHVEHTAAYNESIAESQAKSKLRDSQRGSKTFSISVPGGRLDVVAEQIVNLQGFHPRADGIWLAKRITHTLQKNDGLKTVIEGESPDGKPASGGKNGGDNLGWGDEGVEHTDDYNATS